MKKSILSGIVNQIKEDIGIGITTELWDYSIFDVEFNIIGSENNPHVLVEEGLIYNKSGESITSLDLRYLVYNGVSPDGEYVERLRKRAHKQRCD